MASFLGIPVLPVLMRPTANGLATPSNSSFDHGAAAGQLNRRPAHDPIDTLTARDRERVTAMVADSAAKLGYPLAPPPAPRRNLLRMLLLARRMANRVGSRWRRLLPSPTRPS